MYAYLLIFKTKIHIFTGISIMFLVILIIQASIRLLTSLFSSLFFKFATFAKEKIYDFNIVS